MATTGALFVALAAICGHCSQARGVSQNLPAPDSSPQLSSRESLTSRPALATALAIERQTLERLLDDSSWPRRALAAMRLERYGCQPSADKLIKLLSDEVWQVRAFAVRALGRRRVAAQSNWFTNEHEPRVLRAALRHRYAIDAERLARGVRVLARSSAMDDKMLAVELAAAVQGADADLDKLALETVKQIILKMSRSEAGMLSPRLAALLRARHLHRPYEWQNWLMKTGRGMKIHSALSIEEGTDPLAPSLLARLDAEQFGSLEEYISKLGERELDLAICLDCTASMAGEIAAAQGGIDDMMLFVGDMVSSLRVGLVAYRDRRDEFETKGWDFNADVPTVRGHVWELSADGGADHPEAVYPAMKLALTQLQWRPASTKVLIVVGDAPPHVGYGGQCVNLAEQAHEQSQLTTHCIQVEGKEVKHFPEIAKAGGGRCVSLDDDDALMAEITGLTLADRFEDEFREFFQTYLELCR